LLETTDFTSFSKLNTQTKTNNCKLHSAKWFSKNELLIFEIKADRFLRNMVRSLVGTILELGVGKISIDEFEKIINSKDRSKAGFSVPACGLYLKRVEYPSNVWA
jgi:tRNA pseudouridine38-40 synthase